MAFPPFKRRVTFGRLLSNGSSLPFAISLLLRGAELPNVSILLGHSSIRVTERHYSPWIKARQEQLEADVRRTWNLPLEGENVSTISRRKCSYSLDRQSLIQSDLSFVTAIGHRVDGLLLDGQEQA